MKFTIGESLRVDLDRLVDNRLLVQANSGGGKSWLLRRVLEQTHGHIQHIVIDPEGEFGSLREKFDYVYGARHGGDTATHPRSAKLLAERLLELRVSAILDIYELKAHERISFVRFFLEALVDAKKELWHPVLVLVDEAHVYCPQKGDAESAGAVIDLATRGRKRGFCAVLATQRLSKLHKDAAAELNNKLIGRTGLDVDVARAADELGLRTKDDQYQLRALPAGGFFAFGPAMSKDGVTKVQVGGVLTTHPKAGHRIAFVAPPPTAKVRALLPKLADLPAEAETRHRTLEDLRRELATAHADITRLKKAQPPAPKPVQQKKITVDRPVVTEAQLRRIDVAVEKVAAGAQALLNVVATTVIPVLKSVKALVDRPGRKEEVVGLVGVLERSPDLRHVGDRALRIPPQLYPESPPRVRGDSDARPLKKGAIEILETAAKYAMMKLTRTQLLSLAGGRSRKSSTSDEYLAELKRRGYLAVRDGIWDITDDGLQVVSMDRPAPVTVAELLHSWREVLKKGAREMFDAILEADRHGLTREELSEQSGYSLSSSTFDEYLATLKRNGLIDARNGRLYAVDDLLGAGRG